MIQYERQWIRANAVGGSRSEVIFWLAHGLSQGSTLGYPLPVASLYLCISSPDSYRRPSSRTDLPNFYLKLLDRWHDFFCSDQVNIY